jgi:two-component system sensor histidine kinase PilS (NtrC family)
MSAPAETVANHDSANTDLAGRIVGLTNLYRVLAVLVLVVIYATTQPVPLFGNAEPQLFRVVLITYFVLAALLALAGRRHWPGRRSLVLTHALIDAVAIAVLTYASGGVSSNLGVLLVIPVGSMALLAVGREGLVIAAMASLAILAQQIVSQWNGFSPVSDYPLAGVMGAIVFLVAASAWPVAMRLRESEAQVRRQEVDLANMAQLSQYIVQRLRESILVVDPSDRIRLINESAAEMLGDAVAIPGALLGEVSPRLLYLLTMWRGTAEPHAIEGMPGTFAAADGVRVIEPHFAPLGVINPSPVLIFLEDTGTLAARVQQSKLAALGRLTASIAHEIRNPVGAMSHAAQLLGEATGLGPAEQRMTEIMRSNAQRISGIVDNVLRLSRREPPRPERIRLAEWCARFRAEFCETTQCDPSSFALQIGATDLEALVDPSQLHQILWNLCENAVRHGRATGGNPAFEVRLLRLARYGRVCLEVSDRGGGVAPADVERIFEPFYTRGEEGTGLGLFLARELAEINGATLLYEPHRGGGSLFRLVFADPGRWASAILPGARVP